MTDNIVALKGKAPVNEDLIARLEELLEQARKGDLQALAYAGARRDHAHMTGWTSLPLGYGSITAVGVYSLQHRFVAEAVLNGYDVAKDI